MKNKNTEEKPKGAGIKESKKKIASKKAIKPKKPTKKSTKKPPKKAKKKAIKPQTDRKNRTDSIENSVAIAQAALKTLDAPDEIKLKKSDLYFWEKIIDERANADWSEGDLVVVARLAKYMSDEEELHNQVRKEGYVLIKKKAIMAHGKQKIVDLESYSNPRTRQLDMVSSKVIALRRSLSLHTRGKEGEARDVGKRFDENKKQQKGIMHDDDDDLLASPSNTTH